MGVGILDDQTRKEAKKKVKKLRAQLEEIEEMKKREPGMRRDLVALLDKLGPDADVEEEEDSSSEEEMGTADQQAMDPQKRLKALNKKLQQIVDLKKKAGTLDTEAKKKVATEEAITKEIEAIKAGVPFDAALFAKNQGPPSKILLPTDKESVDKRIKAVKKKLQQITALKEKGGALDAEAKAKVDSERRLLQELAALERGDNEAVFAPPTEDEVITEATSTKIDVERQLKAVRKKIGQIDTLKSKGNLDNDAKAKVANEGALKKELGALERQLGALNKSERDRVANKLGF